MEEKGGCQRRSERASKTAADGRGQEGRDLSGNENPYFNIDCRNDVLLHNRLSFKHVSLLYKELHICRCEQYGLSCSVSF